MGSAQQRAFYFVACIMLHPLRTLRFELNFAKSLTQRLYSFLFHHGAVLSQNSGINRRLLFPPRTQKSARQQANRTCHLRTKYSEHRKAFPSQNFRQAQKQLPPQLKYRSKKTSKKPKKAKRFISYSFGTNITCINSKLKGNFHKIGCSAATYYSRQSRKTAFY